MWVCHNCYTSNQGEECSKCHSPKPEEHRLKGNRSQRNAKLFEQKTLVDEKKNTLPLRGKKCHEHFGAEETVTAKTSGRPKGRQSLLLLNEVKMFLESAKLKRVDKWCDIFYDQDIDMTALKSISEQDLIDIGMDTKGERLKLISALDGLSKESIPNISLQESRSDQRIKNERNNPLDNKESDNKDKDCKASEDAAAILTKVASIKGRSIKILLHVYKDILQLFERGYISRELQEEIQEELGDIPTQIKKMIDELENDEYPIVVTGETSAGKSSFLNLLIGINLLPQSALTSTSTICRIHNKNVKEIYITDMNDHRKKVTEFDGSVMDPADFKKLVKQYVSVSQKDNQKGITECKFVDIYCPIPNLPDGIIIVDTPGLGPDSPELTKKLFGYLGEALASIYILNTPNAGGVQSDRIMKIYEELVKQGKFSENQFDPRRVMFICHKWDQIFEDPDGVFKSIQEILCESWFGFENNKLFKFSSWKEKQSLQEGKEISENFKAVLNGLNSMMPATVEEKMRQHLHWQLTVMERISSKLTTRIVSTLVSKEEIAERLEKQEQYWQLFKDVLNDMIINLREQIEKGCIHIATSLNDQIHSDSVKTEMFSWTEKDLPEYEDMDAVEDHIMKDAIKRINNKLRHILIQEIECVTRKIGDLFRLQISEIEDKMEEINEIMIENQMITLPTAKNLQDPDIKFKTSAKVIAGVTAPITVPLLLVGGIIGLVLAVPIGIGVKSKMVYDKSKKRQLYKNNKVEFATQIGNIFLKQLSAKYFLDKMGNDLQEDLEKRMTNYFSKLLEGRIRSEENHIKNMRKDMRKHEDIRSQCLKSEQHVIPIYGHIQYACIELLGQIVLQNVEVKMDQTSTDCFGEIKQNDKWIPVRASWKSINLNSRTGWQELAEISMLRKMVHPNILQIYGISTFNLCPEDGFMMYEERYLRQLDEMVIKNDLQWEISKFLLQDVLKGLSHLHVHGHVHRNIRLENIVIQEEGSSSRAKLRMGDTIDYTQLNGKIKRVPIIVDPKIKRGGNYGYEADIFQFGFVLWECINNKRAFWVNGKPMFSSYEVLYQHIENNERPELSESDKYYHIVERCWALDFEDRPTAKYLHLQISLDSSYEHRN